MEAYYGSEYGVIRIETDGGLVCGIKCTGESVARGFLRGERDGVADMAYRQLCEYFDGRRREFDLPVRVKGTAFAEAVWREIAVIPFGEVRTYGEIAAAIGSPGASRAVGAAAGRNPVWIVIPCHRVIGAGGRLTGYAGGLEMKKRLIEAERRRRDGE